MLLPHSRHLLIKHYADYYWPPRCIFIGLCNICHWDIPEFGPTGTFVLIFVIHTSSRYRESHSHSTMQTLKGRGLSKYVFPLLLFNNYWLKWSQNSLRIGEWLLISKKVLLKHNAITHLYKCIISIRGRNYRFHYS